jgi:hypothetical protein
MGAAKVIADNVLPFTGMHAELETSDVERVLEVDPGPGEQIEMAKSLPALSDGRYILMFEVRVAGANEDAVAAISLEAGTLEAWDKKLQVLVGPSMLLRLGPDDEVIELLQQMVSDTWYQVILELDLDQGFTNIWVDGVLVASGLQIELDSLYALTVSGWDVPGFAEFDNLIFYGSDS